MKVPKDAIIFAVDGSRMLILRNWGSAFRPDLRMIEHRHADNAANRELLSDAPGISSSMGHPSRSTLDESDPHTANEDHFLSAAVDTLAALVKSNPADIIVAAPPAALGRVRRRYTAEIRARLIAEPAKDLTRHPVSEIARLLVSAQS